MPTLSTHPRQGIDQPENALMAGTLLRDRYMIVETIAQTNMSTVFRGRHRRTGQAVAIKRCNLCCSAAERSDPDLLHAFACEVYLLRALVHPQLPHLFEAFYDRTYGYLVMEYIDGLTLDRLMEQGEIACDALCTIGCGLCDVLTFLHRQTPPVIHADIKPGNILVTRDGRTVLLDLGLARHQDSSDCPCGPAGTPGYAPPEQWRGEPLDARSDLYSLGMVLREMLGTRRAPALERTIARATAWSPEDRLATIAQFRRALHKANEVTLRRRGSLVCDLTRMHEIFQMFVVLSMVGIVLSYLGSNMPITPQMTPRLPVVGVHALPNGVPPTLTSGANTSATVAAIATTQQYQVVSLNYRDELIQATETNVRVYAVDPRS